jgi:hypothetical protein
VRRFVEAPQQALPEVQRPGLRVRRLRDPLRHLTARPAAAGASAAGACAAGARPHFDRLLRAMGEGWGVRVEAL